MKKQLFLLVLLVLAGTFLLEAGQVQQENPQKNPDMLITSHPDSFGSSDEGVQFITNGQSQKRASQRILLNPDSFTREAKSESQNSYQVTFRVNMADAVADTGVIFNPDIHQVYVTGTFSDWAQPGSNTEYKLNPVSKSAAAENSDAILKNGELIYTITLSIPEGDMYYKYFLVEDSPSWANGEWPGDPNRYIFIDGDITIVNTWGLLTTDFAGGMGVAWNPFLVSTAEHLNNVRYYPQSYFEQTADIDLGVAPWNEGEGWMPIGDSQMNFFGYYNGNGYKIRNLTINRPVQGYVGLFGLVTWGTLMGVNLENVDVTGGNRTGTLCGISVQSGIYDCSATGQVNSSGNWVGGLAGISFSGSIVSSCYANVDVEAVGYSAGGLVGSVEAGSEVHNSYATANVTGLRNTGGLIGYSSRNSFVSNCYSTGLVSAGLYVGGLIGREDGTINVSESYWNPETSGQGVSAGGTPLTTSQMLQKVNFEGWDFEWIWNIGEGVTYPYLVYQNEPAPFNYPYTLLAPSVVTASPSNEKITLYWNAPSMGSPTGYSIFRDETLKTTVEASTFTYEDTGLENYVYHTYYIIALYDDQQSNPSSKVTMFATPGFAAGSGTESDPYLVSTPGELFTVRLFLDSYFLQLNDIDLGVAPWNQGEGWLPIGTGIEGFAGYYTGNNKVVKNMYINREVVMYQGLFCHSEGFITDLGVVDADVTAPLGMAGILVGNNYGVLENSWTTGRIASGGSFGRVGGLVGWNTGMITGSHSTAEVNTSGDIVGGLTGANSNGAVILCHASGSVLGLHRVGSLVGNNFNAAMISLSYATGDASAMGNIAGGLAGGNTGNSFIANCYATGMVYGVINVGGLVGWTDSTSMVTNSYSVGIVEGSWQTGGLVGAGSGELIITESYWNTHTSGQLVSAGGSPKNTREMVTRSTFIDWDFDEIWGIIEDQTYPFFLWDGAAPHNYPEEIPDFYHLTLLASPSHGGTVSGTGSFVLEQLIIIAATPAEGYRFVNWTGQTSHADYPEYEICTVTMPAEDISLTANFELITGIYDISQPGLLIYPNPASNHIWIEFENQSGSMTELWLTNIMGQVVLRQSVSEVGSTKLQLEVADLTPGVYLLGLKSGPHYTARKLMINR